MDIYEQRLYSTEKYGGLYWYYGEGWCYTYESVNYLHPYQESTSC